MKGKRLPSVGAGEAELITWRCTKGCALLRVYLSPKGWRLVTWWHAPQRRVGRPGGTMVGRPDTSVSRLLPLDNPWPATLDLDLACRCGAKGRVDLDQLAADVARLRVSHQRVARVIP